MMDGRLFLFYHFFFFLAQSLNLFQIVLLQKVDERSKSFPDLSGIKNQDIFAQPNQRGIVGPKAKKYFQQNNLMKESIPPSPIDKVSERAGLCSSPSTAVTPEDAQAEGHRKGSWKTRRPKLI